MSERERERERAFGQSMSVHSGPSRALKIGAQGKGIAFYVRPSPRGWLTNLCEVSELSTVEKGPVRYVQQGWRSKHFSEGGAEHEGFFTDTS